MLTRIRKTQVEREGGFTLIELLVVIIIIGILASVAIPVFLNQRTKGYDTAAKSDIRNLATQQETYLTDTNEYGSITEIEANNGTDSVKVSKQVTLNVVRTDLANGFCLSAKHASSNTTWWYDSQAGGLLAKTATACTKTITGTTDASTKVGS